MKNHWDAVGSLAAGEILTWTVEGTGGSQGTNFAEAWLIGGYYDWHESYSSAGSGTISGHGSYTVIENGAKDIQLGLQVIRPDGEAGDGEVTITVSCSLPKPPADPAITTQPVNHAYTTTDDVAFTVVATDAVSYEWQFLSSSGSWLPASDLSGTVGYTSASFTISAGYVERHVGNLFRVVVTGAAGTTKAISATVTVLEEVVADPTLSAMTVSAGTLSPTFDTAKAAYTVIVDNNVKNVKVTPTATGSDATITVNGISVASGAASDKIHLAVGANIIEVIVTAGSSPGKTYTITVTRRAKSDADITLIPADGTALTLATIGKAYRGETIVASGGTAPYVYAVTTGKLPKGLALDPSSGRIIGKAVKAGSYAFTITATDAGNVTASADYTLEVRPAGSSFVFTPAPGTALKQAMAGEEYRQPISAKGGTGALIYSLASGSLPDGMILNASTGELTGPLDKKAEVKNYGFTIRVTDASNAIGTASYTLRVTKRTVTVTDKNLDVPAGSTPLNVNLENGATGGPFSSANTTFVEPSNAGTASIVNGEFASVAASGPIRFYLKFIPNPAYSGTAKVGFKLISTHGVSNTGVVTYRLSYDAAKVVAEIDSLVHGFVQARQNLISSSIKVPGLLERRLMETATDPVSVHAMPSEGGITSSFSTSLTQMEAARNKADGISDGYASPVNVWADGIFLLHSRDENGQRWGSFAMINLGADYLLNDKALVGLSFHYDRMTDPTNEDAELTGNGWLAGPYASLEIGKGAFWNTSLLIGGSVNDIDTAYWDGAFDTKRWMIDTSIKGQWTLDNETKLTPMLRAVYFSETVGDYSIDNGAGDEIGIDGFNEEQFRVSLGAELARSFTLQNDMILTPTLGVTGGFSALDNAGMFGSISANLSLRTTDAWAIDGGLLFNIDGNGQKSVGAKAGVSSRF